ncbi:MAG TPA: 50S ribosomal protein L4 [Alphaproteobacteria bacterium]
MKCDVITLDNGKAGDIELADEVFAVPVRADILQRVVVWQLAKRRAGTHKVKGRSEVRATGVKLYRQKGTGRARHGSRKVNLFRGGGRSFGPVVRSHAIELPKKVRRLALKCALASKRADGKLVVLDSATLEAPRTAELARRIAALGWHSALVIDGAEVNDNFRRAARNLPGLDVLPSQGANVYDILRSDLLVLTRAAVAALEARLR